MAKRESTEYDFKAHVHVVPAVESALHYFSRDALRAYAKSLDVDRGRTTGDTIKNLLASHKATMCVSLGE